MNKNNVAVIIGAMLGGAAVTAQAAVLNTGDILAIGTSSWWALDADYDSAITGSETVLISPGTDGGIVIGSRQVTGDIDTWTFLDTPGAHFTTLAPTGSTETGLDFSGWSIFWNGQVQMTEDSGLALGAWTPDNCDALGCAGIGFSTGVAALSWSGVYGDSYSLWYSDAHNPSPGCFGCEAYYVLHLEGTVVASEVPLPAAVWLFGTGLLVLATSTRRSRV